MQKIKHTCYSPQCLASPSLKTCYSPACRQLLKKPARRTTRRKNTRRKRKNTKSKKNINKKKNVTRSAKKNKSNWLFFFYIKWKSIKNYFSRFEVGNRFLDIFKMSIFQKSRLGLWKTLIFWLVTEMLSFSFFVEKCCEHNFF